MWNNDRRRAARVDLSWAVHFHSERASGTVRAQTQDVSSVGFFCIADRPLSPGDQLECDLSTAGDLPIRRRVKVVRVEIRGVEAGFGIACEFA